MKPEIYVDASALPFARLCQWAQSVGYHCVQKDGRVYFERCPAQPIGPTAAEIEELLGSE